MKVRLSLAILVSVVFSARLTAAELPPLVGAARTDLAQRAETPVESIEVALLESRSWPSTALGLPREGQVYAQVVVPGHRVVFLARGKPHLYHTGDKRFILAPRPSRPTRRTSGIGSTSSRATSSSSGVSCFDKTALPSSRSERGASRIGG